MTNGKTSVLSTTAINKELQALYSRRHEVEKVIRYLEEYSDVQAKISRRQQLKSA